jgi:transcriptional regulator with XRE-family HTH domain
LTLIAFTAILLGMMISLRDKRNELGLLLKDAADLLGTDPGNLSRIERGTQVPSVGLAWRMAELYQVSLEQVLPRPEKAA